MLGVLGIDGVLGMEGIDGGFIPPPPPMPDMPDIGLIGGIIPAPDCACCAAGAAAGRLDNRRSSARASTRRGAVHPALLDVSDWSCGRHARSAPGWRPRTVRLRRAFVRLSGLIQHVRLVRHTVRAPAGSFSLPAVKNWACPFVRCGSRLRWRTCRSARRRHGRRFDLPCLRCNVARSGGRDRFCRRPRLRKNRPDHRHHRQGAKPATLAIHDFLNRIVRLLIYGVHLRSRIIHNASTFVDCVSHRGEQISLCLNRFAVALIDDVHPFDHAPIVVAEDRGSRCADVAGARTRGLSERALCSGRSRPRTCRSYWPDTAENEGRELSLRPSNASADSYHLTPTL